MTDLDVIALVILALTASAFALWQGYKLEKVLRDTDHPDHETAKEALQMGHEDRLRFP